MQSLIGISACRRIIAQGSGVPDDVSPLALKRSYQTWLNGFQDPMTVGTVAAPEFIADAVLERQLLETILHRRNGEGSDHPVDGAVLQRLGSKRNPLVVAAKMKRVMAATATLETVAPELASLFALAVNRVVCASVRGISSGSVSHAIGLIWINPATRASDGDVLELLVHELAHTITYIDETLWPHFVSIEAGQTMEAVSAVRGVARPVYHAWHSLIVGVELLDFRRRIPCSDSIRVHPASEELVSMSRATVDSFRKLSLERILTARGATIMEVCCERLRAVETRRSHS
jgi:hypothetical protein